MKIVKYAVVIILLLLCGCVRNENNTVNESGLNILTLNYGANDVCSTDGGIYRIDLNSDGKSSVIHYVDAETLQDVPLCSSASCTHENDTCTAFVADSTPYIFASKNSDKVFIIHKVFNDNGFVTLISSMDGNGQNRKEIFRLKNGESFLYPIMVAEYYDTIYVIKYSFTDENMVESLIQVDYNTGESVEISQLPGGSRILGADGSNLYICSESPIGENQTVITCIDLDNNDFNQVVIPNSGDHSYIFYNGEVYRIEGEEKFCVERIDVSDGTSEMFYENTDYKSKWSFTTLCVVDSNVIISYVNNENKINHLVYNIENNRIKDLTLKITGDDPREAYVTILGYTDKYYYVAMKSKMRDFLYMTPDGTYDTGNFTVLEKRFIEKEDYINNIEKYIIP